MRRFIDVMHENAIEKRLEKSCFAHPKDYGIDERAAQAGLNAFAEAMELAENDVIRDRVEKASIWAYRAAVGGPAHASLRRLSGALESWRGNHRGA